MRLLTSIENRIEILPHFVKHYIKLGIDKFIFCVWKGNKNDKWDEIIDVLKKADVDYVMEQSFDSALYCGKDDSYYQNFIRKKYIDDDEWYVICDMDEFQSIENYSTYKNLLKDVKKEKCGYVGGILVDRVTNDGSIPKNLKVDENIFDQFPINHKMTYEVCKGWCRKSMMQIGEFKIENGHHFCNSNSFSKQFLVYHFKWVGNIVETLQRRHDYYTKLNLPWKNESKLAYTHIMENNGKIKISDDLIWGDLNQCRICVS